MKLFSTLLIFMFCFHAAYSQQNGPFKEYHDNEQLKTEGQYLNKIRVGDWKDYYKSGELSKTYTYHNGKPIGEWKSYYKNGRLASKYIYDVNGKRKKEHVSYYEDGSLSNITNLENGVYITRGYYDSSKLKYVRQFESGYYKEFLEDGTLLIVSNYLNNELSGSWKRYYKNGTVEWDVTYENGYRNGKYRSFYESGQLKVDGTIKNEKKNGKEFRYLENGQLNWKGNYTGGLLDKNWIKFDADGNEIEKIKFKKGALLDPNLNSKLTQTDVPDGVFLKVPYHPDCEKIYGNKARKKCTSDKVTKFVTRKFNINLVKGTNLYGKERILVFFKINETGSVIEVKAKAPHLFLENEGVRVINLLPKFKPGTQGGEPITMPYTLPILFTAN
ncbi:hypothetical protein D7030_15010 [Flavobacteriaceae bacterium AU392]|nr:hypothetical protein D1817_03480 [Flavobacteriaceae bacterium]RKM81604.1 hypothetical protein D7030_15010 [Flavobacteriaceae bacterium AU392]